jgi:hypothetical protein
MRIFLLLLAADISAAALPPPHVAARLAASAQARRAAPHAPSFAAASAPAAQSLAPLDSATGFGWAVAASADGQTVLASAISSANASGCGAVYVFAGEPLVQTQLLSAGAPCDPNSGFGWSVVLSADGSVAAVGAPQAAGGTGAVFLFERSAPGALFGAPQVLVAQSAAAGDGLGWALSMSGDGDTVAAGALDLDFVGKSVLFQRLIKNRPAFDQLQELVAGGGSPGDCFGGALALSADGLTLAVGAAGLAGPAGPQGGAFLYSRGPSGTGAPNLAVFGFVTGLSAPDGASGDLFANALSLSADGLVLAAGACGANSGAGAAYVVNATGAPGLASSWAQAPQRITPVPAEAFAQFAYAAALTPDMAGGAILVAGAPYASPNSSGAVFTFSQPQGGAAFYQGSVLAGQQPLPAANLGHSIAASSGGAIIVAGGFGANTVLVFGALPPQAASASPIDPTLLAMGAGVSTITLLGVAVYLCLCTGDGSSSSSSSAAAAPQKQGAARPSKPSKKSAGPGHELLLADFAAGEGYKAPAAVAVAVAH